MNMMKLLCEWDLGFVKRQRFLSITQGDTRTLTERNYYTGIPFKQFHLKMLTLNPSFLFFSRPDHSPG